ncbi:MAG: phosphoribosylformylglycinamidine synthase [Muribaculaceae bacterium]|nr:phosphoribosylformylglycinamidine synthase [Muribaculaceae bacterium]
MNQNKRIFVEKSGAYRVEAESLRRELNENLGLDIKDLRLICVYDVFNADPALVEEAKYRVFGEPATDTVVEDFDLTGKKYLAVECLPGQFDQRASSAEDCVKLIDPSSEAEIRSARLMIFDDGVSEEDLAKIAHYTINAVESRAKDMSLLCPPERAVASPVKVLEGFRDITLETAPAFIKEMGLAMNDADLMTVVEYFKAEGRDPRETELRILDTYWSDHCRHTTFMTELTDIEVEDSPVADDIKTSLDLYRQMRRDLGREEKRLCLMDLACIGARWLKAKGILDDQEESEENNACSIVIDVDTENGEKEKWLLMFKNETHNHPTEIEPFGGASTCLGGAIRDPLSGRSYVYQAMRVTGAGDIYKPVSETMKGKLPQRVISKRAAAGYSSYGNQIGLATTHVREIFHPNYVAKRLEVGAVVGAVKQADVRRERPVAGDVILMFGGRTGRDGIGGATGSSKEHNVSSLEQCGSEVQKGNAPEERKIERLFHRPEVTRLIKKSNDFGAGGVSVAIGELADGLDIYLDRVPVKYSGLNATELAISESQERMSVVVEKKDMEEFIKYCHEENLEVTHVADVTDRGRMRMMMNGEVVADLSREFIDSAGATRKASVKIGAVEAEMPNKAYSSFEEMLADENVTSQKGLIEMFDSTIGASTVLMPFGGKTQGTETQVSVQKLPTGGYTNTASMMAYGFNPFISEWSPYHGAAYAVVEAVAKVAAAGGDTSRMRFSYQEYFERMHSDKSWGKPAAALLGALKMQKEFGLPSIGGKDSMSGTFADISVPPTLIAFGIVPVDARDVISPEFKEAGDVLYLLEAKPLANGMPDTDTLKKNFARIHEDIKAGRIKAAYALGFGGLGEAVAKMSFGNEIGAEVEYPAEDLYKWNYGAILVESAEKLGEEYRAIGATIADPIININGDRKEIFMLKEANSARFNEIYPDHADTKGVAENATSGANKTVWPGEPVEHPVVYLPVFPGTNCDYDMIRAFSREGAECTTSVFCNLTPEQTRESVATMASMIDDCHVLAFSGGFSLGDEPDGSGKFIASVIMNDAVKEAIERLLKRGGLVIGICNGFQALVKSGLLPFGKIGELSADSPTLFRNDINRHISQIAVTRVGSIASPWLDGFSIGQLHSIAVSHGEGKFTASAELVKQLAEAGQIAFQYADANGDATMTSPFNPNGSTDAIEGIISPDGQILGKMGHSERYDDGLFKNIHGDKRQNLFANAVRYFNGELRIEN